MCQKELCFSTATGKQIFASDIGITSRGAASHMGTDLFSGMQDDKRSYFEVYSHNFPL